MFLYLPFIDGYRQQIGKMGDANTTQILICEGAAQYRYIKMTPFMQGYPTIEETVMLAIHKICEYTSWDLGHSYIYDNETNLLYSLNI